MSVEQHTVANDGAMTTAWEDGVLVLTRAFEAPRDAVFTAWTEPEQFTRWFGPHGSSMPYYQMDARAGGTLHFCHRHTGYEDVWVKGIYQEVEPPERLVFDVYFSDEQGNRVERPGFPREMRMTISFAAAGDGTQVTIRQAGLVVDQGEVQGWAEGLERLETLLKNG